MSCNDHIHKAARDGDLEKLKIYYKQRYCLWNSDTCAFAAENGHTEVLKYLHEYG